ncbi:ABC transporter C family member 7 [Morus notabilis]|uniref:ABC transporter C family member 7 n=1 Tax=Morus notabilis TaxID=981085 RepID=W9RUF1_9ROSA|nr:ABC transporter C family member 7 [Morus notabilis]
MLVSTFYLAKIVENILFGEEMDRERYERVLDACSLKKYLEILPFGDQTVIGERGINLSGGQKQRIQNARALYQDADIYLFDDPFSAVDAHTGSHLFKVNQISCPSTLKHLKECSLGLLSSKTVIYVTHQVEFLPTADLILVMKDGRITQAGKYDEILNSGTDFMELVGTHKEALSTLNSVESGSAEKTCIDENDEKSSSTSGVLKKEESKTESAAGPKGQLVQEEEGEKGRVGFRVYWKYITTAYGELLYLLSKLGSTIGWPGQVLFRRVKRLLSVALHLYLYMLLWPLGVHFVSS